VVGLAFPRRQRLRSGSRRTRRGGRRATAHLRLVAASASTAGQTKPASPRDWLSRAPPDQAEVELARLLQILFPEHVKASSRAVLAISGVLPSGWDETSFREVRFHPARRGVRTWRIPAARGRKNRGCPVPASRPLAVRAVLVVPGTRPIRRSRRCRTPARSW